MLNTLNRLFAEESGAVISAELVLVLTIMVLSMIVGMSSIAHSLNAELEDVAEAFGAISQTYVYNGISSCNASWSGSSFNDIEDAGSCDCVPLTLRPDHLDAPAKCE